MKSLSPLSKKLLLSIIVLGTLLISALLYPSGGIGLRSAVILSDTEIAGLKQTIKGFSVTFTPVDAVKKPGLYTLTWNNAGQVVRVGLDRGSKIMKASFANYIDGVDTIDKYDPIYDGYGYRVYSYTILLEGNSGTKQIQMLPVDNPYIFPIKPEEANLTTNVDVSFEAGYMSGGKYIFESEKKQKITLPQIGIKTTSTHLGTAYIGDTVSIPVDIGHLDSKNFFPSNPDSGKLDMDFWVQIIDDIDAYRERGRKPGDDGEGIKYLAGGAVPLSFDGKTIQFQVPEKIGINGKGYYQDSVKLPAGEYYIVLGRAHYNPYYTKITIGVNEKNNPIHTPAEEAALKKKMDNFSVTVTPVDPLRKPGLFTIKWENAGDFVDMPSHSMNEILAYRKVNDSYLDPDFIGDSGSTQMLFFTDMLTMRDPKNTTKVSTLSLKFQPGYNSIDGPKYFSNKEKKIEIKNVPLSGLKTGALDRREAEMGDTIFVPVTINDMADFSFGDFARIPIYYQPSGYILTFGDQLSVYLTDSPEKFLNGKEGDVYNVIYTGVDPYSNSYKRNLYNNGISATLSGSVWEKVVGKNGYTTTNKEYTGNNIPAGEYYVMVCWRAYANSGPTGCQINPRMSPVKILSTTGTTPTGIQAVKFTSFAESRNTIQASFYFTSTRAGSYTAELLDGDDDVLQTKVISAVKSGVVYGDIEAPINDIYADFRLRICSNTETLAGKKICAESVAQRLSIEILTQNTDTVIPKNSPVTVKYRLREPSTSSPSVSLVGGGASWGYSNSWRDSFSGSKVSFDTQNSTITIPADALQKPGIFRIKICMWERRGGGDSCSVSEGTITIPLSITKGPDVVLDPAGNRAIITLEVHESAVVNVNYGLTSNYGLHEYVGRSGALITNLTPGTTYHYQVVVKTLDGLEVHTEDKTFTTPGTAPTYSWKYVTGDCHPNGTQALLSPTCNKYDANGTHLGAADRSFCTTVPLTSQSCVYTPPTPTYNYTWKYGEYNTCQSNGTQTRTATCNKSDSTGADLGAVANSNCTTPAVTSQSCVYTGGPTCNVNFDQPGWYYFTVKNSISLTVNDLYFFQNSYFNGSDAGVASEIHLGGFGNKTVFYSSDDRVWYDADFNAANSLPVGSRFIINFKKGAGATTLRVPTALEYNGFSVSTTSTNWISNTEKKVCE